MYQREDSAVYGRSAIAPDLGRQLTAAYRKALAMFGGRDEISAIDVGYRYEGGERTDEAAVRVHYAGDTPGPGFKLADAFLRATDGVPLIVIPAIYGLHPALAPSVVQAVNAPPRRRRVDPLQPGVSISHSRTSGGTLGLVVYDIFSARPCLLSNHHVLVPPGRAGDDSVVQPAASDGGIAPVHTVARVIRSLLDVDGDAAVAQMVESRGIEEAQWESGVVVKRFRDASLGDVVEKSGARTGVTRGVIDGIGRYYVSPANPGGMDGFRVVPSSGDPDEWLVNYGDSGAVWYRLGDEAGLGLHVGGDAMGDAPIRRAAVACHLSRVMRRLGVSIVPLETRGDDERRSAAAGRCTRRAD